MSAPDREAEALINYLCEEAEHEVECAGEFTELAKQLRSLEVTARRLARESITNKQPTDAEVMNHPKVRALAEALDALLTQVIKARSPDVTMNMREWQKSLGDARAALDAIQEAKP